MNKKSDLCVWVCTLVLFTACKTDKMIYLQDMPVDQPLPIAYKQETRIKPADRLDIHVSCLKQELAVPFNALSYRVSDTGQTTIDDAAGTNGYLVDDQGYIEFPVLGRLHVAGLTMPQASAYIKGLLVEGHHLPDAIVETTISNFTIYGLGALSPGKLVVKDAHINILQAIAQMGDLQARADIKRVRVLREDDGQRMEFDIDLRSKDLYESPAFFLQQNDMVYAEPKRRNNENINKGATLISALAVLASLAYSITYIFR
ncbi:MAG: polysaccharide biosynthesis/export family protein [Bacteroidaceae bacterium]|nr:polysaccharide biosynthesis/export family protein [Bacteroidaceae bacterium]